MEFLYHFGLFGAKAAVIIAGIVIVFGFLAFLFARGRAQTHIEIDKLNDHYKQLRDIMQSQVLDKKQWKKHLKKEKKNKDKTHDRRVFVLDFDGDIRAAQVEEFREEITALLTIADEKDEVVVVLESPGGLVSNYGLAASQMLRLKDKKIKLTVCVDKVAASGGYMMACVADQIVAAPFAVVGSIGVVASLPNFHRLLNKHDIDYREVTAGEYKRTVSILGEITPQGFEKFKEQLEETHLLFKDFVKTSRPQLDVPSIATGEHWYGVQALEKKLIDKIQTSDDYLFSLHTQADIYSLRFQGRKRLSERISETLSGAARLTWQKAQRDLLMNKFGF